MDYNDTDNRGVFERNMFIVECVRCGCEFDVSRARRVTSARYGAGIYNDIYPDEDVCEECACEELCEAYSAGGEVFKLMGDRY